MRSGVLRHLIRRRMVLAGLAVLTGFAARPDDLLVVGTQHDHALKALVHGSVSAYCLKHARCPVVTVEPGRHPAMAGSQPRS